MTAPYRNPCAGTTTTTRSRCCGGTSAVLADKYTNTTTVPNPALGTDVAPYERFVPDPGSGDDCRSYDCNPAAAPCEQWQRPFAAQTFHHTAGETVDFAVTKMRGFKNVFARRFWNGRFGYKDIESSNGVDTVQGCSPATTAAMWRSYKTSSPTTRYTKIVATSSWTQSGGSNDGTTTASCQETIDPLTGIHNNDSYVGDPTYTIDPTFCAFGQMPKAFWHWTDITTLFFNFFNSFSGGGVDIVWTAGGVSATDSITGQVYEAMTWDFAAGTFHRDIYGTTGYGTPYVVVWTEDVTVTDSTFVYEFHAIANTPTKYDFDGTHLDIVVTGTLSVPITAADLYTDAKGLLGYWNLADHKQYPFRTSSDNRVGCAPLMSRDEIQTNEFSSGGGSGWIKNYGSPIANGAYGFGDPSWIGNCNAIANPNPDTGTALFNVDFAAYNSGAVIDIQITNPFNFTPATSFSVLGGSFPPGVSMNGTGHITGTVGDDGHWGVTLQITAAIPRCDGSIRGAPKPAGYQNPFDFDFKDYRGCCYTNGFGVSTWEWWQFGWGMSVDAFNTLSSTQLPRNATQWTNWWQGQDKPQGAFIFYNDQLGQAGNGCPVSSPAGLFALDAGALWLGKYCEVLDIWNSQDFAKPGGEMKFWVDELHVLCATHVSGTGAGSVWALIDPTTGMAPTWSPDLGEIWGGPCAGGFYAVTAWDGTNITLGTKQFDLPSNWTSKSEVTVATGAHDSDSCFGPLRFPTAPSLLGRVAITTAGTTATFAAAQPQFGMGVTGTPHQEHVDLYDSSMTLLASNVTVTRTSDTQFSTPTAYATAVWVTIHGAPAWYMHDNGPKGDFVTLEFLSDFRSAGETIRLGVITECDGTTHPAGPATNAGGGPATLPFASFTQTQHCLPVTPCGPKIACFSPNGETFPNGITLPFPDTFEMDQEYGSKWWGYVQQTMTELFWQRPHRPCNIFPCAQWKQDGASCDLGHPDDGTVYACPEDADYSGDSLPPVYLFEFFPQVEARLTVPANYGMAQDESAPALPAGIQIGWASPVFYDYTTPGVAFPPSPPGPDLANGEPGLVTTTWLVHDYLCASAAGCRFNYSTPAC